MLVLYSPQLNEIDVLEYEFTGDKVIVTYNGEVDEFDFTDLPDGFIRNDRNNQGIVTTLSINPVLEAQKENGILKLILVKFIGVNATEEERFPNWIEV